MARKSRKNIDGYKQGDLGIEVKTYRTAAYIRLSVEDSGRDCDTIETQKHFVLEYIKNEPSLQLEGWYCDNGSSGTNFERSEFERLMADIKKGLIDCVVVKDLSRFGRNYKETGNYIERIFPFLGIRFLAINDQIDTLQENDGYVMPLKNLVNEFYCKDLSKKITTVLETKQRNGEYIGSWAPYGYHRTEDNVHKLEIDSVTAPVVKKIYKWTLEGVSYIEIKRRLNGENIACPFKYLYELGFIKNDRYDKALWSSATIKQILSNPVYLGHMVQGRHRQSFFEGKKRSTISPLEWKIVKNTHPALITKLEFEEVQELNRKKYEKYHENKNKYEHLKTEKIFLGKVYCAFCNHEMIRDKQVYGKKVKKAIYEFTCFTHAHAKQCFPNYFLEEKLKEILFDLLKQQIQLAVRLNEMLENVKLSLVVQKRNTSLSINLKRNREMRESLYQNYVDHLISEEEFKSLKKAYTLKIKQAENDMKKLDDLKNRSDLMGENVFLKEFGRFQDVTALNREVVDALVEKIYVAKGTQTEFILRYRDEYEHLISNIEETEAGAVL